MNDTDMNFTPADVDAVEPKQAQETQPDGMPTDLPDNEPVTLFSGPVTMISGDGKDIPGYHLLATDRHASEVLRVFATFLSLQGEKSRANEARSRALNMEDWYFAQNFFLSRNS